MKELLKAIKHPVELNGAKLEALQNDVNHLRGEVKANHSEVRRDIRDCVGR
jgi:outer membrane murein-binding lipoprotein Lpp